jgi:hypothetical protein
MEEQLQRIVDFKHVYGVMLWHHGAQGYLGALLDFYMKQITGSTPWNPLPTVQEVLDSLERAATTLRERAQAQ